MKISFNTLLEPDKINKMDGYGYATDRMLASLQNLGYEVSINDPKADVGIVFNQPHRARWFGNQYRILYHPWESTKLLRPGRMTGGHDWLDTMNSVDEIWTPSPLIKEWYHEYSGVTTPVYVYQHGVDEVWEPRPRVREDKLHFLHIGGQSVRKGLTETLKGFRYAFPTQSDVQLNLKVIAKTWQVPKFFRVTVNNGRMELDELINMHYANHVFVYPSWGEGFGLMPLQAMATGMPTITSRIWAPYSNFLDRNLSIGGDLVNSPWPVLHPGKMIRPNFDELVESYRYAYDKYDSVHAYAQSIVPSIKAYYSWDRHTKMAFESLRSRLEK